MAISPSPLEKHSAFSRRTRRQEIVQKIIFAEYPEALLFTDSTAHNLTQLTSNMNASSSLTSYHRLGENTASKLSSVLLLLTNGLLLGAGLRYAIIRLFIQNTRQIETQQHEHQKIDASDSKVGARISQCGEPVICSLGNGSADEHAASSNLIVSIRGLKNYGQTCYCNSVLQALASLKPFYNHLESMHNGSSNNLIDALRCTIQYANGHEIAQNKEHTRNIFSSIIPFLAGKSSRGDPKNVMDIVAKHHSQFRSRSNLGIAGTNEQHDSHEFLTALMDVLSTTVKSSQEGLYLRHPRSFREEAAEYETRKSSYTIDNTNDSENEYNQLQEEKKLDDSTHSHHHKSSITKQTNREERTTTIQHDNPFDGWLGSTIKCAKCHHIRPIRSSPFICLSLPIATVRSEYLDDFLASEYGGFSTAERVSDVQCVACAIKEKLEELEDEAMLLSGAIASMGRRNKGKNDQAGLQSELVSKNRHIAILKGMDADNDDEIQNHNAEDISFNIAGLVGLPKIVPMRGDAFKATLIMRPPKVLCIHVQRRHFDMASQRMVKISRRVHFPEVLDLSKYCAYAENSFENDCENECMTKSTDGPKMPYRLMSVVEHLGSAFGGHYQTYRRLRVEHNEWVLVSDESVVPKSWKDVQACEAYMLLYEEMTTRDKE